MSRHAHVKRTFSIVYGSLEEAKKHSEGSQLETCISRIRLEDYEGRFDD